MSSSYLESVGDPGQNSQKITTLYKGTHGTATVTFKKKDEKNIKPDVIEGLLNPWIDGSYQKFIESQKKWSVMSFFRYLYDLNEAASS